MLVLQGRPFSHRRCAVLLRQVIHARQHLRHNAPLHLPLRRLALCSNCIDLICIATCALLLHVLPIHRIRYVLHSGRTFVWPPGTIMTLPPPCMRRCIGSPYHPLERLCRDEQIRTTGYGWDDLTLAFSLLVLLVIYGRKFSYALGHTYEDDAGRQRCSFLKELADLCLRFPCTNMENYL